MNIVGAVVRRLGPYAPLSHRYFRDPAVVRAKEKAELLYVRGLAYCADSLTDGFIPHEALIFIGAGLRGVKGRAATLVREDVDLWAEVDGGYQIRNWEKWNRTAAELERIRAKDRDRKAGRSLDLPPEPPEPEDGPEYEDAPEPAPAVAEVDLPAPVSPRAPAADRGPADVVLAQLAAAFRVPVDALLRRVRPGVVRATEGAWPVDVLAAHLLDDRDGVNKPSAWLAARLKLDRLPQGPAGCDCAPCSAWRSELDETDRSVRAEAAELARRTEEAAAELQREQTAARAAEVQAELDERNDAVTAEIGPALADALVREHFGTSRVIPGPGASRPVLAAIYAAYGWDVGEIQAHAHAAEVARQVVA